MKMQCEIIRDLIPLIEDDVCSQQSKDAVSEHIKTCASCRNLYKQAKIHPVIDLKPDDEAVQKSVRKGFKKIKRRWAASVLLVILLIPVVFLSWGQINGRGISFTNLHEILIADSFLRDLKDEDYQAAFLHLNIEPMKEEWIHEWFDAKQLENYESDAQRVFCESASLLKEIGGIEDFQFLAINHQHRYYIVYYTVVVNGKEQELTLDVTDEGIERFSGTGSYLDDPVSHFGEWTEFLWQEYEGCYFDPETHQYQYNSR